jgi:hypothetical protein
MEGTGVHVIAIAIVGQFIEHMMRLCNRHRAIGKILAGCNKRKRQFFGVDAITQRHFEPKASNHHLAGVDFFVPASSCTPWQVPSFPSIKRSIGAWVLPVPALASI